MTARIRGGNSVGFSSDVSRPALLPPADACDCHMHIVGPLARYPFLVADGLTPPEALVQDYQATAKTMGLSRCVIVQPSFFADDNDCTLSAVATMGDCARAIVVVREDISDVALRTLHDRGARGIRSQMVVPGGMGFDGLERLAPRVAALGWHLQMYADAASLIDIADRLRALAVPIVFDHMAQVHRDANLDDPGFRVLLDLLASGKAWVKLSNARFAPDPARARALYDANPDHVVWGSDWPHVLYDGAPPDDGRLLDALSRSMPDADAYTRVLSINPNALYFR